MHVNSKHCVLDIVCQAELLPQPGRHIGRSSCVATLTTQHTVARCAKQRSTSTPPGAKATSSACPKGGEILWYPSPLQNTSPGHAMASRPLYKHAAIVAHLSALVVLAPTITVSWTMLVRACLIVVGVQTRCRPRISVATVWSEAWLARLGVACKDGGRMLTHSGGRQNMAL